MMIILPMMMMRGKVSYCGDRASEVIFYGRKSSLLNENEHEKLTQPSRIIKNKNHYCTYIHVVLYVVTYFIWNDERGCVWEIDSIVVASLVWEWEGNCVKDTSIKRIVENKIV